MQETFTRREGVLFDVVLTNGQRVAELLPRRVASGFARVWNRLPRPKPERARVVPTRWAEIPATD